MQSAKEQQPRYVVVLEPTDIGYSVYVPDLPGCVSVGESRDEAIEMITEAIELHIESLREHGEEVPTPRTLVDQVSVRAA